MATEEERIERLLDQLEDPRLSAEEIDRINKKIEILKALSRS